MLVLSNSTNSYLPLTHDPELTAHMPESFQLMIKIQQEAEAEYNAIVADIKAGRTTLEAVRVARGMA